MAFPKPGTRLPLSKMTSKHEIEFDSYTNKKGVEVYTACISHPDWDVPANPLIAIATDEYPNGFELAEDPSQADYDALMEDILTNGIVIFRKNDDDSEYQLILKKEVKETGFGVKAKAKKKDEAPDNADVLPVEETKAAAKKKATTK